MENAFPMENVFPIKNGGYSSHPYVSSLRGYLFFVVAHIIWVILHTNQSFLGRSCQRFRLPRLDSLVFLCGVLGAELSFFVSEFSSLALVRIGIRWWSKVGFPQITHTENESQRLNERGGTPNTQ